MPIIASRVTVGTVPTLIINPLNGSVTGSITAVVKNPGPNTVFVGGEFVTTASGYPVQTGGTIDLDLISGDLLYGIVSMVDVSQELQTIKLMS